MGQRGGGERQKERKTEGGVRWGQADREKGEERQE